MRTTISIPSAGLALLSTCLFTVSCTKADVKLSEPSLPQGGEITVTASITDFDYTKVDYCFESDARGDIKSEWVEGDEVIGFDNLGNKFKFTVKTVNEFGDAVFDTGLYRGGDANRLFVTYCPGMEPEDFISDGNGGFILPLGGYFSSQGGKLADGFKALMCATGDIALGSVHLDFKNQTAIVGIYRMQVTQCGTPVPSGTHISRVTLSNVFTQGSVCVKDGLMQLSPYCAEGTGAISAQVDLVTAEGGFIEVDPSDPDTFVPYFAVVPGGSDISLSITDANGIIYRNQTSIPSRELLPGRYYYLGKVMDNAVAAIGPVRYPSLQAAMDDAGSGPATITMVSEDAGSCVIPEGRDITLDLAGRTLRGSIAVNGSLTVKDDTGKGRIVNDEYCIKVNQNGSLVLNGGIIEGSNDNDQYTSATIVVGNPNDEIDCTSALFNGGSIIQNGTTKYGALYLAKASASFPASSSANILSAGRAVYIVWGSDLTIAGGSFKWNAGETFCYRYMSPVLSITGGRFSDSVMDYVSPGYDCVDTDDEIFRYRVVVKD